MKDKEQRHSQETNRAATEENVLENSLINYFKGRIWCFMQETIKEFKEQSRNNNALGNENHDIQTEKLRESLENKVKEIS